jgi:hypothetical protein
MALIDTINKTDVDIIIDAGDLTPEPEIREWFKSEIKHPYYQCMGNHDFYRSNLSDFHRVVEINRVKIVLATLWTNFDNENPYYESFAPVLMESDYFHIKDMTVATTKYLFQKHLKFIEEEKPDIVVTHHIPSSKAINSKWLEHPCNPYFYSDLDQFILDNPNIKVWHCGHTHYEFDFNIGNTRLIINPLGYPHERPDVTQYKVKIIEIEDK